MSVMRSTRFRSLPSRAAMEALGVNHYVVKPFTLDAYMKVGQLIKEVLAAQQPTKGTRVTDV